MSAVPQELRERMVIDLIEQGLSNVKINKRTGVDRAVIARIRKNRPPAVAFTPEPGYDAENFLHDLGVRPPGRADADAAPAPVTETGTALNRPNTDPQFVKQLTQRVATIVRHGPEGPRIAKIKNVGNPFMVIVADVVDRLLAFRTGQKIDYTKPLPKALAAADRGDSAPLVKLVTRAARTSRTALLGKLASASKASVDLTDIDKVTEWVRTEQAADTETAAETLPWEPPPSEVAAHDASANVPQHLADIDVPSTGALVERIEKDEDGNSTGAEMLGSFELSNTGALATSGEERDLGGGNTVTGAAFTVGEEAQLDARDRTDRGDSANYKGAPKTASGFRKFNDGSRMFSEGALAAGGQRPTWSEMTAPPRATMTDLDQDMIEMAEMERLARRALRLQLAAEEAPNQNQYGIGTPRPHEAIVLPEPGAKSRGDGRVRRAAAAERKEIIRAEIEARVARMSARIARDATRAARDYERALAKTAREAEDWAQLVKRAAKYDIGEETLLQLKQKWNTSVSGLGELLVRLMK